MKLQQNKILIQIGANKGWDEFSEIAKASNPELIVLIEPIKEHNASLMDCYRGFNIAIENVAITENEGSVTLSLPKNEDNGKFSLLPLDDWDIVETLETPGITFQQLCEIYKLKDIHFLQIDTEGYDAEIIKSIDFKEINIDIIKYERWDWSVDCFTSHGDKGKEYGIAGMHAVENLLRSEGYELEILTLDIIARKCGI